MGQSGEVNRHSAFHPFNKYLFIECLVCARHHAGARGKNTEKLIACIHTVTFYLLAIAFFAANKIKWRNNCYTGLYPLEFRGGKR